MAHRHIVMLMLKEGVIYYFASQTFRELRETEKRTEAAEDKIS